MIPLRTIQVIKTLRDKLQYPSDEQRTEVFSFISEGYCESCGRKTESYCHCENEE